MSNTTADQRVNSTSAGFQGASCVTGLRDGGWVVAWTSVHADGTATIETRRFDAAGRPVGQQQQVASGIDVAEAALAATADGGYLLSWTAPGDAGSGLDVHACRFGADGVAGPAMRVNTQTASDQRSSSIAALADGGWIVAWASLDQAGGWDILAQRFGASGSPLGGDILVNRYTTGDQDQPTVAALADGGWAVAWASDYSDAGRAWDINAQRFAADGSASGAMLLVNGITESTQWQPVATGTADGGFLVAWASHQPRIGWDIYAQRFAADGTAPAGPGERIGGFFDQDQPAITQLASGAPVVAWTARGQDGDGAGVYATQEQETRVNSQTQGDQSQPAVAALDGGGYVVTWTSLGPDSDTDIHARRFDDMGQAAATRTAGAGLDLLHGTAGADRFVFALACDCTTDGVLDQVLGFGAGDLLDLSRIDARPGSKGNQAFQYIGDADFRAGQASGQLRFDAATGMLWGSTDADAKAEFGIALVGLNHLDALSLML
jgi:hypothetical protein